MPTSQSSSKAATSKRGRRWKKILAVVLTVGSLIATAVGTKNSARVADVFQSVVSALTGESENQ